MFKKLFRLIKTIFGKEQHKTPLSNCFVLGDASHNSMEGIKPKSDEIIDVMKSRRGGKGIDINQFRNK